MNPASPPASPSELGVQLDDFLAAFEAARDSRPDPTAFLPPPDHPLYAPVLRELLRVDLEFAWDRGVRRRVEEYCERFPELAGDPVAVRDLASEEFRLRKAAGENPDPREYRDRLGVDLGEPANALHTTHRHVTEEPIWPVNRTPAVGDTIPPGYELTAELGRGAFGRVFLARETGLAGRPVAVKLSAQPHGEQLTLARLQHTNIVPVYAAHRVGSFTAQVMPFLGRTTLADLIMGLRAGRTPSSGHGVASTLADGGRRTAGEGGHEEAAPPAPGRSRAALDALERMTFVEAVLWIGAELADGLAHAHDRGVLHRDIKPANVLFTDDGRPMLLDFNLAGAGAGQLCGTPGYMAPEQLEAARAGRGVGSVQSDVYALGLVLLELLAGRWPFPEPRGRWEDALPEMIAARQYPLSAVTLRPDVTPGVRAILAKCLDPDPAARYASAADLREDLNRQRTHRPLRFAREGSARERVRKWARRHPRLSSGSAITAASLLVIAVVTAGFLVRQRYLGEHLGQLEADAARVGLRDAREFAQWGVKFGPAGEWRDVRTAVTAALAPYKIESDDWVNGPLVTRLPEAERAAVRTEAAEVMFRAAAASAELARDDPGRREALLAEAAEWNRRARVAHPGRPPRPFLLQQSQLLREAGKAPEAEAALAEAMQVADPLPDDLVGLGFAALEAGRFAEAAARLAAAARTGPPRYSVQMGLAAAEGKLGRFGAAIDALSGAATLTPSSPWPYFHRGVARLELGDPAGAVPDFDRFLELAPEDSDGYLNRAIARLRSGDGRGAIADVNRAAGHGCTRTRLYAIRAEAYRLLGETAAANCDRATFLALSPTDALSYCARGQLKLEADPPDRPGARDDFDAALRLNCDCLVALRNKAHVLSELGQPAEALAVLDRVLELTPGSPGDRAGRAVLLARLSRTAEARREVEACAAGAADGMVLYQLASAALVAGDKPGGLALVRAALRKDPALGALMPTDADLKSVWTDPTFLELLAAARVLAQTP